MLGRMLLLGILALYVQGCTLQPAPGWEIENWRVSYKGCKVRVRLSHTEHKPRRVLLKCKRTVSWLGT